jgi:hypothetical protein
MDLRPHARELRGEFLNNARPAGNAFIQGIQSRSVGDCEGEMMKADIGAPVERDCLVRRLDPPYGDNLVAVRDECRGIFRPLANDAPPQAIAEEAAGALKISDAQTDVIDAACGGCGVLCHGILLWCADDIGRVLNDLDEVMSRLAPVA